MKSIACLISLTVLVACTPETRTLTLAEATGCALEDQVCLENLDRPTGE